MERPGGLVELPATAADTYYVLDRLSRKPLASFLACGCYQQEA